MPNILFVSINIILITELYNMSKFNHPLNKSENVYLQFRFESSLRKYEKPPSKKIKCDNINTRIPPKSLSHNHSPLGRSLLPYQKGRHFKERQCPKQQQSPNRKGVSESETIRLSNKQLSNEASSNQMNNLQKKIYESLQHSHRKAANEGDSIGDCSSGSDDVYLNDFQRQPDIDEEKNNEDADFGAIQIQSHLSQEISKDNQLIVKDSEQLANEVHQQKNFSPQSEAIEQCLHSQIIDENCQSLLKQQISKVEDQQCSLQSIQNCTSQRDFKQPLFQQYIHIQHQAEYIQQVQSDSLCPSNIKLSKTQNQFKFEGGRIRISALQRNYFISVRVFDKLRRTCSNLEQLIDKILHQRPYLESTRQKFKEQLNKYF